MCRLLSGPVLVLRYLRSLVRSSAPGFSSVSSHPSMAIWVQTKKVCVICTSQLDTLDQNITLGCGGLQEQIPHQGLDPQCTSFPFVLLYVAFTFFVAIIVKIKTLSQ
jgi:hypothetical protein